MSIIEFIDIYGKDEPKFVLLIAHIFSKHQRWRIFNAGAWWEWRE